MIRDDGGEFAPLGTLFRAGTAAGLTDGQLLERFATRGGEAAELAFAALVERHGPMVRRTCLALLGDEHDAQDAFQATFLVLARRGGSLWVRDSIGPWLHRVASRAAGRARREAARRRSKERRAAEAAGRLEPGTAPDELAGLLLEEVDRLPDRYRAPVVLCDLEGRSYEEAARHLGCPVGTVKSRLARGRDRLRGRLARRGFAPGAAGVVATLADVAPMPSSWAEAAVAAAVTFGAAGPGAVSAPVVALAEGVIRTMLLAKLRSASQSVALGLAATLGLFAAVASPQSPEVKPTPPKAEAKPAAPVEPLAWRRADRYIPPDFDAFFPDDPEGGRALDALWNDPDKDRRPAEEVLRTVRRGLRRVRVNHSVIVRWIGGRFIWGADPQDPEAIEILYHAADPRPSAARYGTRHFAVYFGLSVVEPKTPAILHTLVDVCWHGDDYNDWERTAWGAKSEKDELLAYMKPYLASTDEAAREKAVVLAKVLGDEPDAAEATTRWSTKLARAKYADRLPGIVRSMRDGDSAARKKALGELSGAMLLVDGSFFEPFRRCADDPDPTVRREVAWMAGNRWVWSPGLWHEAQKPEAIELELTLSRDPDPKVRYNAVYHGLSVAEKSEAVVRRLVEIAETDHDPSMRQRIAWGLNRDRDKAAKALDADLTGPDPARAEAARSIYKELVGREPPGGPADAAKSGTYEKTFRDLHEHLWRVYPNFDLKGIDWAKVGREMIPRAAMAKSQDEFGLLVEELVARLEDSHAAVLPGKLQPPTPDLPKWDPGLACTIDDRGRPVVHHVDRGSPAALAGIAPGMAVVSVDGVKAAEAMDRWMTRQRTYVGYSSDRLLRAEAAWGFVRRGKKGERMTLVLESPDGATKAVEVAADLGPRYLPRLPVPRRGIADAADVSWTRLDGGIGYVDVRRIRPGLEGSLDRALRELGDVKGLILDVRGNSGGGFDTETAFAPFDPAAKATPDRPQFAGPVALLLDERTISAGEGWASWFVAHKRARTFGATSAGASSRKTTYDLTDGSYKVVVPVKAYAGFLDRPIERRGIEPDEPVRGSAADLARGRDAVVEAAARWLGAGGDPVAK